MAYVIAEPCIGQKDNSCVEVCPVDCIHPTPDDPDYDQHEQLYIDPDECIDCGACEPECPVNAIFPEDSLPAEWAQYTELDARWYKDKDSARATIDEWKPPA
jgi:NAD-dependent dihydropyrimidine dehydrogenase PreA subunit